MKKAALPAKKMTKTSLAPPPAKDMIKKRVSSRSPAVKRTASSSAFTRKQQVPIKMNG